MYFTSTKAYFFILSLLMFLLIASCDDPQTADNPDNPNEQVDPPPTSTDPNGTSEYYENGDENARTTGDNTLTGTYIYKDPESPEGSGYLVIKQLDNGRIKFELDLNNGPPNYHTGTATGEIEVDGNTAVFTTSEYKMSENQQPCAISFLFVDGAVELNQEQGSDMSCGFGQGVVATGIYNKKNNKAMFQYEGGR